MDIYKHKDHGLVVFINECKIRKALGGHDKGTAYQRLEMDRGKEKTAKLLPTLYVERTACWKARVKPYGTVTEVKAARPQVPKAEDLTEAGGQ